MTHPEILDRLLQDGPVLPADWFAVPIDARPAQRAAATIRRRLLAGPDDSAARFKLRLAEIITRYWVGHAIAHDVNNLAAALKEPYRRALLTLSYGQLLMARRLLPAHAQLDKGFLLAAHALEPEDYFRVLKRHALLRQLPLGTRPAAAAGLETLLNEARVIDRLRGPGYPRRVTDNGHRDTLG